MALQKPSAPSPTAKSGAISSLRRLMSVQNQLGMLGRVQELQHESGRRAESNQLQVRIELQADCFAGVWANRAQAKLNFIEPGDVEAAMQTAAAIGDDRLQRRAEGRVVPDSFTHGSSAQRVHWFTVGLNGGTVGSCNTFDVGPGETIGRNAH